MTNILTWNPTKWSWDDYAEDVKLSKRGESLEARWSTGNTKSIPIGLLGTLLEDQDLLRRY